MLNFGSPYALLLFICIRMDRHFSAVKVMLCVLQNNNENNINKGKKGLNWNFTHENFREMTLLMDIPLSLTYKFIRKENFRCQTNLSEFTLNEILNIEYDWYINQFITATFLCLSRIRILISIGICRVLSCMP